MANDLRKHFDDQGWELFKAACELSDALMSQLAKSKGEVTKLATLKTPTVQDAIAKALSRPANANSIRSRGDMVPGLEATQKERRKLEKLTSTEVAAYREEQLRKAARKS